MHGGISGEGLRMLDYFRQSYYPENLYWFLYSMAILKKH